MTTRTEYIEKMKAQLDDVNAGMDRLGQQAADAQASMRATYLNDMARLRTQSAHAKAKMDELKAASEDGWDAMVAEMDRLRDAFVHAFKDFKSRL